MFQELRNADPKEFCTADKLFETRIVGVSYAFALDTNGVLLMMLSSYSL